MTRFLEELKGIWWEAVCPATAAEIVCIGGFAIAWLLVCALMSGA